MPALPGLLVHGSPTAKSVGVRARPFVVEPVLDRDLRLARSLVDGPYGPCSVRSAPPLVGGARFRLGRCYRLGPGRSLPAPATKSARVFRHACPHRCSVPGDVADAAVALRLLVAQLSGSHSNGRVHSAGDTACWRAATSRRMTRRCAGNNPNGLRAGISVQLFRYHPTSARARAVSLGPHAAAPAPLTSSLSRAGSPIAAEMSARLGGRRCARHQAWHTCRSVPVSACSQNRSSPCS